MVFHNSANVSYYDLVSRCSMITDESKKKSNVICHFLINIAFYYERKAVSTKSVLWCSRCKFHRYIAAPSAQTVEGKKNFFYNFLLLHSYMPFRGSWLFALVSRPISEKINRQNNCNDLTNEVRGETHSWSMRCEVRTDSLLFSTEVLFLNLSNEFRRHQAINNLFIF
jgi:hypothetical protein